MAETKRKGDIGEAMVMADVLRRGYKVAIPVGEDWRYDLIVLRGNTLERVQCKYVESDGAVINIPCRSSNANLRKKYTADQVDWIAAYDKTSNLCYYLPSSLLGDGKAILSLRLLPSANGQMKRVRWAKDYTNW